jgi:hypothetical protein
MPESIDQQGYNPADDSVLRHSAMTMQYSPAIVIALVSLVE